MEYKIIFEEVVDHEFHFEADSLDEAIADFEEAANAGTLNFMDGDVIVGQITRVVDGDENCEQISTSFADLDAKLSRIEAEQGKTITFNVWPSSTLCRITAQHALDEIKAISDGGCICDLEVMLSEMKHIKEACAEKGYRAVFEMM